MPSSTTKYRYVGEHAVNFSVGDNVVPVGPGEFINLSDKDMDDPYNKVYLDVGKLINAEEGGKK